MRNSFWKHNWNTAIIKIRLGLLLCPVHFTKIIWFIVYNKANPFNLEKKNTCPIYIWIYNHGHCFTDYMIYSKHAWKMQQCVCSTHDAIQYYIGPKPRLVFRSIEKYYGGRLWQKQVFYKHHNKNNTTRTTGCAWTHELLPVTGEVGRNLLWRMSYIFHIIMVGQD